MTCSGDDRLAISENGRTLKFDSKSGKKSGSMQKCWLYAIRLDDAVLDRPKFVGRNPNHKPGKPCYYIGSSIYSPKVRFEKHKAGERSSWWVREYGLHPSYKKCYQIEIPNQAEREAAERDYAQELRDKGYGIWQN